MADNIRTNKRFFIGYSLSIPVHTKYISLLFNVLYAIGEVKQVIILLARKGALATIVRL
jgi:hypothetical protein